MLTFSGWLMLNKLKSVSTGGTRLYAKVSPHPSAIWLGQGWWIEVGQSTQLLTVWQKEPTSHFTSRTYYWVHVIEVGQGKSCKLATLFLRCFCLSFPFRLLFLRNFIIPSFVQNVPFLAVCLSSVSGLQFVSPQFSITNNRVKWRIKCLFLLMY